MNRLFQILTFYLLLFPNNLFAQKGKDSYSPTSVLSSGEWFRIAVIADGIYRIDYSKLKQLGLVNPSNPRIFCNNFGQLSYYNNAPKPDDLKELSIFTSTGNDGIFNEGDYLLFFGKGTKRWIYNESIKEYDFLQHNYSDTAFYFITSGLTRGKRVLPAINTSQPANYTSSESDALFFHEKENENLIKSGREWFQPISGITGIGINPGFTELVATDKVKYSIRLAARASGSTFFRLYEGQSLRKSIQMQSVNLFSNTGTYAQITDSIGSMLPGSTSPVYEIRFFNNGEIGALGWIDFVKLQGRKANVFRRNGIR